jgi:hypothetical protein
VAWIFSPDWVKGLLQILPVQPTVGTVLLGTPLCLAVAIGFPVSAVAIIARRKPKRWLLIYGAVAIAVSVASYGVASLL